MTTAKTILVSLMSNNLHQKASFRDPAGYLFTRDGVLYRQVNQGYEKEYRHLIDSGLYDDLVEERLLIPHQEVEIEPDNLALVYKTIQPERVQMISYPYEWCFSQLKDAALLTLTLAKKAVKFGLSLKDASAYNIAFHKGKPILIDTLSFELYNEGQPWVAYRQFCQHFFVPLALMALRDVRLNQLMRVALDGIPLDMAVKLLPFSSRFNIGVLTHIYLHARAQQRYAGRGGGTASLGGGFSRLAFFGLLDSLETAVKGLKWQPQGTEWGDYYGGTNYSQSAFDAKEQAVRGFLDIANPQVVWDLGANTGIFTRLASQRGALALAFDKDPAAVEKCYHWCKVEDDSNLLPLVLDLTNPSPAIGWANNERANLVERGPADLVMALALVHHLAISNNLPLDRVADYFTKLGRWLIVEFIPKEDSQVQRLLASRKDIFPHYSKEGFEEAFGFYYVQREVHPILESQRVVYLMEKK
jgi:hypothetical protein